MSTVTFAIKVENLSKSFELQANRSTSFKEMITNYFKNLVKKEKNQSSGGQIFRALHNVSFNLEKGETLGIIGENGAGKSTLLTLLSQIMNPTNGSITLHGKVASILGVGTGFHPDLTGRDNILLNGILLGLTEDYIKEKMEAIIEFSDIGRFIDEPVKNYSNGMFLRLAFSVVTNLDAEIILIDEVLNVGDAEFRVKSFDKIKELSGSDRTVVLVSHDLGVLEVLCSKCLWLDKGRVKLYGNTRDVVSEYMEQTIYNLTHDKNEDDERIEKENQKLAEEHERIRAEWDKIEKISAELTGNTETLRREKLEKEIAQSHQKSWTEENAPGNDAIRILSIAVKATEKAQGQVIYMGDGLDIEINYQKLQSQPTHMSVLLTNQINVPMLSVSPRRSSKAELVIEDDEQGTYKAICHFPSDWFNSGLYIIDIVFIDTEDQVVFIGDHLFAFRIQLEVNEDELFVYRGRFPGPLLPKGDWTLEKTD